MIAPTRGRSFSRKPLESEFFKKIIGIETNFPMTSSGEEHIEKKQRNQETFERMKMNGP